VKQSLPVASTAVSLAKVAVVDSGDVGRSTVCSRYNNGSRTVSYVENMCLKQATKFHLPSSLLTFLPLYLSKFGFVVPCLYYHVGIVS
jgi:hypothetical protein